MFIISIFTLITRILFFVLFMPLVVYLQMIDINVDITEYILQVLNILVNTRINES